MSAEQRLDRSEVVLVGRFIKISEFLEEIKSPPDRSVLAVRREYQADFEVASVEKGDLKPGTTVQVLYWKFKEGQPGSQGQNAIPMTGDKIRLFATKGGDAWQLLAPNGWEPIAP